eukprot:6200058-Pleurochrysis_carterae.AAC.2
MCQSASSSSSASAHLTMRPSTGCPSWKTRACAHSGGRSHVCVDTFIIDCMDARIRTARIS